MYLSKVWFGLFFNAFTTYLSWATCNVTVSSYPKVPNVKKYILEDTGPFLEGVGGRNDILVLDLL